MWCEKLCARIYSPMLRLSSSSYVAPDFGPDSMQLRCGRLDITTNVSEPGPADLGHSLHDPHRLELPRVILDWALAASRRILQYFVTHQLVSGLAIFALAFLIRLGMLIYLGHIGRHEAAEVDNIAMALLTTHRFADPYALPTGPTAHTTPFYPLLVAVLYRLFGSGYAGHLVRSLLVIGAYSFLYSLYPWLASSFGFSNQAGLIAGFASALLPVKRSAEVFLGWEEPYAAMALAILLLLILKHRSALRRKSSMALCIGLVWGIAFYISFSLAAVLGSMTLVDLALRRSWTTVRDNVCIVLAAMVVISPWIIRNRVELHGWTLMRTAFGQNMWCSNNDHAHPAAELINADPIARAMYPFNSRREALKVRQMGELAYDRHDLQLAFAWIRQHRGQFARLSLRRFLYFWMGPFEHTYELVVTTLYTLIGLLGLWFVFRFVGAIQFELWVVTLISFPLIYYFIQYVNRYRTPIDWMVWLSAGQVLAIVAGRWRATRGLADSRLKQAAAEQRFTGRPCTLQCNRKTECQA